MPMIGVSHGEWHIPTPDPPPGDYVAVLIADQASWRITSADDTWEVVPTINTIRLSSPPGLPAVWYAWRGGGSGLGAGSDLSKTTNNGTSWAALASNPFEPSGEAGGVFTHWPDHIIAATDGILLTARWSSQTTPGTLHLKNIYYSLDDGASWAPVYASDLADGNTTAAYGREHLVANTVYSWFVRGDAVGARRISHGGGLASETTIAMPVGSYAGIDMLACDSTLAGEIVYAVAHVTGENKRRILRTSVLAPTQFVDVTPPWDLADTDLGNVWIAVAGDVVMALAYGYVDPNDTGAIWRSTNAGLTWNMVHTWDANLNCFFSAAGSKAVGVNPNRPQTWFVWANNHEAIGSRVLRTPDQGETWISVPLPSADPLGDDDQLYYEVRVLG